MKQQNAFSAADQLVCPKPRRLGLANTAVDDHHPFTPRFDSAATNDPFDLLFFKGGRGLDNFNSSSSQLASSPPFLCGSPPSRVSNPLIQDARFGDPPFSPAAAAAAAAAPSSSPPPRKGGCVRVNFGNNPAVRIEGFDCRLDRERRNRSIPALG